MIELRRYSAFQRKILLAVLLASLSILISAPLHARSVQRIEQVVENGPASIHVLVEGRGDDVVLIPSLGRGAEDFDTLAGQLVKAGYRAIRPQPRGIGLSSGPMEHLTLHDWADDVAAVIRALGGGPVTLVGHALGNRLARVLATDHPALVKQIVLIGAGGHKPIPAEAGLALLRCFDESLSPSERLAAVKQAFFAEGNDPSPWEYGWHKPTMEAQRAANHATPAEEWWAGGGRVPLLVLQAEQDAIALPGNAADLIQEFAGRVTLAKIPNAGHAMLPEQPELVGKTIIRFLAEHK